jgi:carboxypeptidase family protein/TonB-dependent receptor-like protein
VRLRQIAFLSVFGLLAIAPVDGQSPNGTISGIVVDPSGAAIVGAEILIANDATGVQYPARTNGDGFYLATNLPPGTYRLQVSNSGFKTIIKPDIVIHVQDALAINFTLPIGAASEVVTVQGGAPLINTESAAVSTVIDRQFVESLPLNGRSFNTLLQLTPGVVIGAANGNVALTGQFSVAGQRTESNNFLVDGVSANFGVLSTPLATGSGTGTAQAFSVLGGTSSLVSVEALQEFRVETSSFAPEFGRTPGGQVILTTRAGTNSFHGGVYEYFRNDVLDANDWFSNQGSIPRAPERHNDFGGYLGGPIWKDKTFFFASYEGARLRLPQTSTVQVPSLAARQSAPAAVAPILNAYPLPNGAVSPGGDTANFIGSFSNQGTLNAGSIRLDHTFSPRFSIFGRYNEAPSQLVGRVGGLSTLQFTEVNTRTLTIGINMILSSQLSNTLRANYSKQKSNSIFSLDNFAGAVPVASGLFLGSLPSATNTFLFQGGGLAFIENGPSARNHTNQLDFVDDLGLTIGRHRLKFGGGYRGIFLDLAPVSNRGSYSAQTVQGFLSTSKANLFISTLVPSEVLSQSVSVYGQDTWKVSAKATVTYGVRWEASPAPTARGNTSLAAWTNVNTSANIALAPVGSRIWGTTYGNFAPRVGLAYSLTNKGDFVFRAGAGIFYDLAAGSAAAVASSFPNTASKFNVGVPLPVGDVTPYLGAISLQPPYPNGINAFDPNLKLPRSYQWNVALEKSFSGKHAISATYVAQAGRDLLRQAALFQPNSNFSGAFLLAGNDARSNYNAAQLQYRSVLSRGLQALLNYTWSHSLDNASNDVVAGLSNTVISAKNDYGSSDFDVRHSFSGAITYSVPAAAKSGPFSLLTKDWFLDTVVVARSGFPFNGLVFLASPGPTGFAFSRPDLVPGQPLWITNSNAGGGKSLNPGAFLVPSPPRQGTEGRNDIPGFGLTQVDLSFRRKVPITERLNLQFRADAFNMLNHPNFQNPEALVEFGPFFLASEGMLNQGLGGLNPLFQEGGPRSLQLSLKLTF